MPGETTKYIVLKVDVEHDESANVDDICHWVEVSYDRQDGFVTNSEVVNVYDKEPKPCQCNK
jgi:hypothetical protein